MFVKLFHNTISYKLRKSLKLYLQVSMGLFVETELELLQAKTVLNLD